MSLIERLLSSANALLLDSFFATFAASIVVITLDAMLAACDINCALLVVEFSFRAALSPNMPLSPAPLNPSITAFALLPNTKLTLFNLPIASVAFAIGSPASAAASANCLVCF